jgi:hypothetical protein
VALFRRQNQICLGGNHNTWWLIKTMLDAGWTMPFSGSGSGGLYSASNVFDTTQIPKQWSLRDPNNVGVGSEPWGHASCWAVVEDPGGNRQYVIMRDSDGNDSGDDEWYIGYSPGGRFGEGQVAGTDWDQDTPAAAPDQLDVRGTPTSWTQIFESGGVYSVTHVLADSTPSPGGEYGVFLVNVISVNNPIAAIIFDDLRDVPTGHPHPLSILAYRADGGIFVSGVSQFRTIYDYGGASEVWTPAYYTYLESAGTVRAPGQMGINRDGKIRGVKALVGFGVSGYMGVSRWYIWEAISNNQYPLTANSGKDVFLDSVVVKDLLDGTEPARAI